MKSLTLCSNSFLIFTKCDRQTDRQTDGFTVQHKLNLCTVTAKKLLQ